MHTSKNDYAEILSKLYPKLDSADLAAKLLALVDGHTAALAKAKKQFAPTFKPGKLPFTQADSLLISYGDSLRGEDAPQATDHPARLGTALPLGFEAGAAIGSPAANAALPATAAPTPAKQQEGGEDNRNHLKKRIRPLESLANFAAKHFDGVVSGVHVLPFFPSSSDDGFSIMDFYGVDPALGGWEDLRKLAGGFRFMADLVLNHCSAQGQWFLAFLEGDPEFGDFFIELPEGSDVSMVVRPRTHPLLTRFEKQGRPAWIWTTFSTDQVDLNFANPRVLLRMIDVLFHLVEQGCSIVRLDAVAYLWKELGTPCIHHPNTHRVVKLFRKLLDSAAPWVQLMTETNVKHEDNISYFGDGDEAQLVYQFSLPPLILDAVSRSDSSILASWAQTIAVKPDRSFFNFAASHDGVGVTPSHGILSQAQQDALCKLAVARGGRVSYKAVEGGKTIPYELNCSYLDLVADPAWPVAERAQAFLASQSILLILPGLPGLYVHSLLGSENFSAGPHITGANRSINREKLFVAELEAELAEPGSLRSLVLAGFKEMLGIRAKQQAFHPAAALQILAGTPAPVLALLRLPEAAPPILCLTNLSRHEQTVDVASLLSDLGDGAASGSGAASAGRGGASADPGTAPGSVAASADPAAFQPLLGSAEWHGAVAKLGAWSRVWLELPASKLGRTEG